MIHCYQKDHRKVLQILLVLLPLPCLPLKITAGLIRHYETAIAARAAAKSHRGWIRRMDVLLGIRP